ncbi:MAG: sigma-54 dependent transcriptional regulator [Candidatus Acidiferrales bacterium]
MTDDATLCCPALPGHADYGGLIGESAQMRRLYELIARVSQRITPVLVMGETGTGKELVARAIHFEGLRRERAFVPVDCSALTPTLVESELFGHVRGAFTGAQHSKMGLFEAAHEGTIFLDEVGELPTFLQAKLLRTLQEKEIRPVGSAGRIPIDARVIAATNRDLEAGARAGTFRQDLFFRLNVVEIRLPALRERKGDIPLLVDYFLKKFSDQTQPVRSISDEALRRLIAYDWPGNVRELEHAIERAMTLSSENILSVDDLACVSDDASARNLSDNDVLVPMAEMERRAILRALQNAKGDKIAAARLLQIGKTTLYRKLKLYARSPAPTNQEEHDAN